MCFETECIMILQGCPRSLILVPIESAYGTSCCSSIVTLVLSYAVSDRPILEFLYAETQFFHRPTPPLFQPKFRVFPFGTVPWCWRLQRANTPGDCEIISMYSDLWSRYLNVTDRRTDSRGQTTCRSNAALCVILRGNKNVEKIKCYTVCIH